MLCCLWSKNIMMLCKHYFIEENSFFDTKLLISSILYFIFAWFAVFHNSRSWWSGLFGKKFEVIWCSGPKLYGGWRSYIIALSTLWGGIWTGALTMYHIWTVQPSILSSFWFFYIKQMRNIGIYSRLDQVFDAPNAVREVLTGQCGLDRSVSP